ncbi:pyruvate dehydrogenase E1 subunit alpha 1b isoform X1 [Pundamilia nyererei]|uniref:Pyruvate dehydrogenase E1 subunit alpha 1b isoform X1 n=1 Tax=Pundamilia nyererei TaxID=303518 RepID=A0A9Y6SMB2_9CICH|nr:PREDICTED: uncharacterized protein LOC106456520 isoform X1 [Pundamilia nyererei]
MRYSSSLTCRAPLGVLWSDWLAPFVPQLLTDLSEFVDLTSPAAPASAQTQRLPPKPPPTAVSTRAASALLVSGCADRPVRTREASSMSAACSLTGPGNLTRAAAWMDMYELRTNDPTVYAPTCLVNAALRPVQSREISLIPKMREPELLSPAPSLTSHPRRPLTSRWAQTRITNGNRRLKEGDFYPIKLRSVKHLSRYRM